MSDVAHVRGAHEYAAAADNGTQNQPPSSSLRDVQSVLFGVGMPQAGERDSVAVRPGAECSRAGYSRAAAGGYEFCRKT
jgi:hypothetical protein